MCRWVKVFHQPHVDLLSPAATTILCPSGLRLAPISSPTSTGKVITGVIQSPSDALTEAKPDSRLESRIPTTTPASCRPWCQAASASNFSSGHTLSRRMSKGKQGPGKQIPQPQHKGEFSELFQRSGPLHRESPNGSVITIFPMRSYQ
jgi:hypothetical protein